MHRAEVEVAFGGDIGNVGGDVSLFAKFPDSSRCLRIVDGCEDHVHVLVGVEVRRHELAIDVGYLALRNAVGYLWVKTGGWAYYDYVRVCVEAVENAAGSDLISKGWAQVSYMGTA